MEANDENKETTLVSFGSKDYTTINFEAVGDIITEWTAMSTEFSSISKAADDPTFKALDSAGLGSSFPADFDKGITTIIDGLNSAITDAQNAIAALVEQDNKLVGLLPRRRDQDDGGGNGNENGNGNGNGAGAGTDDGTKPPEQQEIPTKPFDVNKISTNDYGSIIDTVLAMADGEKVKLDELLKTEGGRKQLLENLLKSNISDDLKKELQAADLNSFSEYILSLLSKDNKLFKLDEISTQIVKNFVDKMMEDRLTSNSMISSMKVKDDVIKTLNQVGELFTESLSSIDKNTGLAPFRNQLQSIYDGNYDDKKISKDGVSLVRTIMDYISDKKEISTEELLADDTHSESILNAVLGVNNYGSYLGLLNKCSDDHFKNNSMNLFNDKMMPIYREYGEQLPQQQNKPISDSFVPTEGFE